MDKQYEMPVKDITTSLFSALYQFPNILSGFYPLPSNISRSHGKYQDPVSEPVNLFINLGLSRIPGMSVGGTRTFPSAAHFLHPYLSDFTSALLVRLPAFHSKYIHHNLSSWKSNSALNGIQD